MSTQLTDFEAKIIVTALAQYAEYLGERTAEPPAKDEEWGRNIAVKIVNDATIDLMVRLEQERSYERT